MKITEVVDPALIAQLESGEGFTPHPMAVYGPAVRYVESRGNPNAVSPAGAIGADQFMPATAAAMGLDNPRDPVKSAVARDLLLAENYARFKDPIKALQAYNAGPRAVETGRLAPETRDYTGRIQAAMGYGGQDRPRAAAPAQENGQLTEVTDPALIAQLEAAAAQQQSKPSALPKATAAAPKKSSLTRAAEDELAKLPWYQRAAIGAGKAAMDVVNTGKRLVGAEVDDTTEIDAALDRDAAAKVGNVLGEIGMTLIPGAGGAKVALKVASPVVKMLPKAAQTVTRLAAGGAGAGAASEAALGRDPMEGALIGAVAAPIVHKGASLVGSVAKGVVNNLPINTATTQAAAARVRSVFDDRLPAAVQALRNLKPTIDPGTGRMAGRYGTEQVTVGHAATEALPEFKVFEEIARRRPGADRLLTIDAANAKVREDILEEIAKRGRTPTVTGPGQALADSPAEAARRAATEPLYDQAQRKVVTLPPRLEEQLLAPEARPIVQAAQDSYAQAYANAPRRLPTPGGWSDPANNLPAVFNISELQFIRNSLNTAARDAAARNDTLLANRLSTASKDLLRHMEASSPAFAEATRRYRVLSGPQNRAQVAQALIDALRSPAGTERASSFLNAMRNAPRTLKSATGTPRYEQLGQVMTKGQMERIGQVQKSLEREAKYASLRTPESTVKKIESVYDKIEELSPPWFSMVVTGLRRALKVIGNRTDEEVSAIISRAVADKDEFLKLLETLPRSERSKIVQLFDEGLRNEKAAMLTPSVVMSQANKE